MKAIRYYEYGSPDVLQLQEIDKPVISDDEALVRVRAASTNPYDWHFLRGRPYFMRLFVGLRKPRSNSLGADMAGQVEAVGSNVTQFRPGDEVFGFCKGSFAEYACAPAGEMALKPANLTFEQAAAVPMAALTALQGLRDTGQVQPEQKVLIIGAGGGVGIFAVQIAKLLGAHVTGVCSSGKVELVRSLGADQVIDYTQEDVVGGRQLFDLVFELAGTRSPGDYRRALNPGGTLVLSSGESDGRWIGPLDRIVKALLLSPFVSQKLVSLSTKSNEQDLRHLAELIEAGRIIPVIDRTYSLDEVPQAIRHIEEGHARGKVVITM